MTTDTAKLRELLAKGTQGPWGQGQPDMTRIHPDWRDDDGNSTAECFHRNGFAKTIATVGKEDGDWRPTEQQFSDVALIVAAVNALPALLDEVEGLNAKVSELVRALQMCLPELSAQRRIEVEAFILASRATAVARAAKET
jgi:hypothetical protein